MLIPYAIDKEYKLYKAEEAKKDKYYFCPSCGEQVILRKGTIRTAHFAHKPDSTCSKETVIHKTAKLLIQEVIQSCEKDKTNFPIILRECKICRNLVKRRLPNQIEKAILEYKLPEGHIVDVALIANNKVVAAVKIKVFHSVNKEKEDNLKIPFIEVDGYDIVENPSVWKPLKDTLPSFVCEQCKISWTKFKEKANKIAQETNIQLPNHYYLYGIHRCWKCGKEILVFAWPGSGGFTHEEPNVKPVPRTIQYRYSNTIKHKYWANTCPYCNSIQGDFFLYCEPEGPFFVCNYEEYCESNYQENMLKIASYAKELKLL
ncbi:Competence protein CoiA-like family protein [Caldanaerobius fijiensis DSM 17918]|uniref:Competence protein CoiA-like family protein n=1 Tax=Caldanaerobius fijiensis DSM 17918 TaxID=1121256 RepID=A0A1M5FBY0_9THEO|nr:competence protein CoiA family protein [Caldanaerobius fijiensis]SHF89037.1 Competence protein CoiA-like family protein [Caldanaerobius fijiensis DSM 17918]